MLVIADGNANEKFENLIELVNNSEISSIKNVVSGIIRIAARLKVNRLTAMKYSSEPRHVQSIYPALLGTPACHPACHVRHERAGH